MARDILGEEGGRAMNHTKYRVWLISITLAAVIFGVIWYVSGREEEKTITDGTLVYHELPEEACFPGRSRMARGVRL